MIMFHIKQMVESISNMLKYLHTVCLMSSWLCLVGSDGLVRVQKKIWALLNNEKELSI